jgi:hypothetical protein
LNENKTQLSAAVTSQAQGVQQANAVEQKLTSMVEDLLLLAKTDEAAKAIVGKYGIQLGNNGAAAPSAPAAEPAK